MRCTTCGTDNEPDSRFCGNCGAKVTGSVSPGVFSTAPGPGRVAPTQKIPPNGPASVQQASRSRNTPPSMPPPVGAQPVSVQIPPTSSPRVNGPSQAPAVANAAQPRTNSAPKIQAAPPRTSSAPPVRASVNPMTVRQQPAAPRPAASAPSIGTSIPRRGRNWPLIVILFIIDLGLAGAGALMLQRGLIRDDEVPVVKK